jgi:hypothetical protein
MNKRIFTYQIDIQQDLPSGEDCVMLTCRDLSEDYFARELLVGMFEDAIAFKRLMQIDYAARRNQNQDNKSKDEYLTSLENAISSYEAALKTVRRIE